MGKVPPPRKVKTHRGARRLFRGPPVCPGMRTPSESGPASRPVALSIGILAWNEEASIGPMLDSLFAQSLFRLLAERGERCEIICLANGCTDHTVAVTRGIFKRAEYTHPYREGLHAWVAEIPEPGRNGAWNRFIHEFSAREARFLCVMDADILFNRPDTLELVLAALERDPLLGGASDWPLKDISLKPRKSLRDRLSLAGSEMTGKIAGRLNGMLYCLRTEIARNLYLPRDLSANDDGFFKAAICTDFFRAPLDPTRVVSVREATHLYEPYLSLRDVINNQKRQMIGQTFVHLLLDRYLPALCAREGLSLADAIRKLDEEDPQWLRRIVRYHVGETKHFWELFPGVCTFRYQRWALRPSGEKLRYFPAMVVGSIVTAISSWMAWRSLRRGLLEYWPEKPARPTGPADAPPELAPLRPAPTA